MVNAAKRNGGRPGSPGKLFSMVLVIHAGSVSELTMSVGNSDTRIATNANMVYAQTNEFNLQRKEWLRCQPFACLINDTERWA